MMELNKYKNDGWGINLTGFEHLLKLIKENDKDSLRVLEFGSGASTEFFCDVVRNNIKSLDITSFDDNENYSYKKSSNDEFLKLNIRPLVECNDLEYNEQFILKEYNPNVMSIKTSELEAIQKNNFYKLDDGDLSGYYDIVLIDGPHGNGRNFAFLHIKNYIKTGTIIFIDDYCHYDFLYKCQEIFDCEIIKQHDGNNDYFVILKIN